MKILGGTESHSQTLGSSGSKKFINIVGATGIMGEDCILSSGRSVDQPFATDKPH